MTITSLPATSPSFFYQESCSGLTFQGDYSLAYHVKNTGAPYVDPAYPSAHNLLQDPLVAGPLSGDSFGMTLTASSPAIDAGTTNGAPALDFNGNPREGSPDMGAYEYCALAGDLDGDRQIGMADLMAVAADWHRVPFDPAHDLDGNGAVDVMDVMIVAATWGAHC